MTHVRCHPSWILAATLTLACTRPISASDDGDATVTDTGTSPGTDTSLGTEDSAGFAALDEDSGETGTGPVDSHDEDILPYWAISCVIYCHGNNAEGPAAGLSLEYDVAYDALVGVPSQQTEMLLVSPGSTEDSYLWHKLQDTHLGVGGSGVRMPKDGAPLGEETMARIETWLLIGAPP